MKTVFSLGALQLFAEEGDAAQVTGVTETDAGSQSGGSAESGGETFEELIKGRYKAEYDARVRSTIQQRLRGSRETVEKYRALEPAIAILEKKYGVEAGDAAGLERAIREDNAPDTEAQKQAMTAFADRVYNGWMNQAEQAREIYPGLDLRSEMRNPRFVGLLRSHVDVKTAYEVVHKDEIIPAAMQYAARTVEARLAESLACRGSRPAENAMGGTGAVIIGNPVSSLSRRDIADIARRVERGERISFG